MEFVYDFLNNLLQKNDTLVVSVSGGPDSMCLLHVLKNYQQKLNLKIICAHVNHHTRCENEIEAEFVKNYCTKNNIIFEYLEIKKYPHNKFNENDARRIRYKFLIDLVNTYKAKYIMTAHHGDDLMETVLMRIVRGSILKGYVGIPKISYYQDKLIVRPLLYINKDEILNYLKVNKQDYVIDKSNNDEKYTRNRFRKHMLPFLKSEDKDVHLKFLKFSEELERYNNYFNEIVTKKIAKIYKDGKIYIDALIKEDYFLVERIVVKVIEEIQKDDILDINDKELQEILKLVYNKGNRSINLANGYIAKRSYNYLIIMKEKKYVDYEYLLEDEVNILNKYKITKINSSNKKSNDVIRLNSKEVLLPLKVRNIRKGDKIEVKNLNGHRKVSDIYIDLKIDQDKRKEYPLVVDSNNCIIWVPGLKKSIFDKEKWEKYDIILKYTEE